MRLRNYSCASCSVGTTNVNLTSRGGKQGESGDHQQTLTSSQTCDKHDSKHMISHNDHTVGITSLYDSSCKLKF